MTANDHLTDLISSLIAPLGYEVVWLEAQTTRERILRIYIDYVEQPAPTKIGIQDCVRVTKHLDEPLDQNPEVAPLIEKIFQGTYELEVSSPGIERPLRRPKDYLRFAGSEVRVHTFRPLTAEECGNSAYQAKNPRQKNFLGTVLGIEGEKLRLALSTGTPGKARTAKAKKSGSGTTNSAEEVTIPLPLISKANLEPRLEDVLQGSERELSS